MNAAAVEPKHVYDSMMFQLTKEKGKNPLKRVQLISPLSCAELTTSPLLSGTLGFY